MSPRPHDQTGAVEGVRTGSSPHVRVAQTAHRRRHRRSGPAPTGGAGLLRQPSASPGPAPRCDPGAAAGATASTVAAARLRAAAAAAPRPAAGASRTAAAARASAACWAACACATRVANSPFTWAKVPWSWVCAAIVADSPCRRRPGPSGPLSQRSAAGLRPPAPAPQPSDIRPGHRTGCRRDSSHIRRGERLRRRPQPGRWTGWPPPPGCRH